MPGQHGLDDLPQMDAGAVNRIAEYESKRERPISSFKDEAPEHLALERREAEPQEIVDSRCAMDRLGRELLRPRILRFELLEAFGV